MNDEIFEALRDHAQQIIPCWALADILAQCGLSQREISHIICEGIKRRQLGTVHFGKPKRKPTKSRLLVIM